MKIIHGKKGTGKTTELIKKSSKENKYIVCANKEDARRIAKMAIEMELNIPYPIVASELPVQGYNIKSVLVDDIEAVLQSMIGRPVDYITSNSEIISK